MSSKNVVKSKGTDMSEMRRRRETHTVQLRKNKREEGIEKKRKGVGEVEGAAITAAAATPQGTPGAIVPAQDSMPAIPTPSIENLASYCAGIRSEDLAAQWQGVGSVRRLLSQEANPPVAAVLSSGILGRLIHLLASSPHSRLQFEAAWAITNIASTEHTGVVVEAGAIPPLVAGMMAGDPDVRDQCIWCIGNIAGDSPRYRDMLLSAGVDTGAGAQPAAISPVINGLMANLQAAATPALMRNATWTLSNFCRGKPSPSPTQTALMVPALAFLLGHSDREVVQDAAWGLSYLSDGAEAMVQCVLDAPGVVPRCVALMGSAEATLVVPALRVVGNLISGSDAQTQAALDGGALGALLPLLSHPRRNIKREAAWALSNVAAGTPAQLSAVMAQPGLMGAVVGLLGNDGGGGSDWNVRKEAAWVVSNVAAVGTLEQCGVLLSLGVSRPLTEVLGATRDARILGVVLDAVEALLGMWKKAWGAGAITHAGAAGGWLAGERRVHDDFEEAGLLDALETVQQYAPDDIYARCGKILTGHFPMEEEEGGGDLDEGAQQLEDGSSSPAAAGCITHSGGAPLFIPTTSAQHQSQHSISLFMPKSPTVSINNISTSGGGGGGLSASSIHNTIPMFGVLQMAPLSSNSSIGPLASCGSTSSSISGFGGANNTSTTAAPMSNFSFTGMSFT